ncbi:LamG-like jellyroll fold domain-containing protein [Chloroflexota bacterium]
MKIERDIIFDPSLVLYLPFYKLDGSSFMSEDAYGHLCTITGALWTPGGRSFDHSDDYLQVGDAPGFDFSDDFTMQFWVWLRSIDSTSQWLVSKGGGWSRKGFFTTVDTEIGLRFGMGNGSTEVKADNDAFSVREWHFISALYEGTTMKVFQGCDQLPNTASNNYDYVNNYPVRIGGSDGSNFFPLDGLISEAWLYSRALKPAEIQHNYLATKWRYK